MQLSETSVASVLKKLKINFMPNELIIKQKIKRLIWFFIIALLLSGITAFPIQTEMEYVAKLLNALGIEGSIKSWYMEIKNGLDSIYAQYPFIAYGTDWLAFAHIVIAIAFIGPLRDPVKNIWVIEFGMIACVLVVPLALICGPIREIPFFHQLIDCSFGVIGFIPLFICRRLIKQLGNMKVPESAIDYLNSITN